MACAFAVLCGALVLSAGSTPGATSTCPAGATLNVVAHPDDDLLFLSPDLLHDMQGGRCVRTVFVTAGERNDSDLMLSRESGMKAAYAQMAGVANSWTTTDAGVSGHPMPLVTLANRPSVSLVFMRLPEGFWGDGGTSRDETLKNLWLGTVSQIHADDGSSAYTTTSLTAALTSLMTAFRPDTIRTQDYVGTFGDGDHDDHHAAAYLARQAHLAYTTSHTFIGYQDYETENRPQNIFDPDLTAKKNALYAYLAFDSAPCGSPPNCGSNEYADWLKRQYVVGMESGVDTTPPTVASVTPAAAATDVGFGTNVSATFSESLDPASVTTSSFVLRDGSGTAVAASASASRSTATLDPTASLSPSTSYTATLTGGSTGVKDLAGNALAADYSWSFTTAAADTTPPAVASVTPAAAATGVGFGTNVSATFSESLDPASVTTSSFVLRDGSGTAVAASVSASGSTATLDPTASLSPSTSYTATLTGGSTGVKDLAGNALAADYSWSFTTAVAPACPCSIWAAAATPQTASVSDATSLELGVRFQSDVAGFITGIRFYKGSGNTGTHVGHLWTASGTQLAGATFSSETATGWQQVLFASPVAISANTPYIASYYAPAGHFSLDRPYFTTSHDNAPLHALADGAGGGNGLYREGTGVPTNTYQSSNYWVDVIFTTDTVDSTPPVSTTVSPAASASYNAARWNAGCASPGICGTAADAQSGVKKVELSIRQGTGNYWDGSAFANAAETFVTAVGTTSWSYALPAASFPSDGQYTIRVRATDNAGNLEAGTTTTFSYDTSAPGTSTGFPAASGVYNAAGWTAGCASPGFCGTASDTGSGLQKVELSIRRGTGNYWNGTSFASASEVWVGAIGATSWSYSFPGSSFPSEGSYTVRVRATDKAANIGAPTTTTFVYDATSPGAAVTFPVQSGKYNTASWNAGCASPGICGTAADAASGVAKVEISIRRGSGNYWNGTSFSSTTEVFLTATGTTVWSFAFPASSFPAKDTYTIRLRATDNAGNVATPSTKKFSFSP